ncbi:MAG TPA: YtxH domain-containing protein [Polyangiales bacterium]|nr:YtxH domain-containing protein [Polyangiales bacterium]
MWDEMLKSKARTMRDLSTDDILSALGLQRTRTPFDAAMPTTLAFIAGAAAGAGIALLLAPKSGREIRQDLSDRASELTKRIGAKASEIQEDARTALPMTQSLSENRPIGGTGTLSGSGTNRSTS